MDIIRINLANKMRLILSLILFQRILFAQDSLFWFDMSKVRDPIPKTPIIMDKIFGLSQFTMIDSLKKIKISTLDGYRLQLYESSSAGEANKKMAKYGKLIRNLKGDRVAIIVFAGTSHLYLPLTTDYEAALLFLNEIDSKMIPTQGTVLSKAMLKALESFSNEIDKFKVMLLISDGEDHDDQAVSIASKASNTGFVINTVGVGSKNGSLIPIKNDKDQKAGYKRDGKGNLITSIPNETVLKEIATAGGGTYFWFANSADSYQEIAIAIENMEKKTISTHEFSEYEDRYQIIALSSLFCYFIGFVIPTRKKHKS